MKKGKLLHGEISQLVAEMGHGDTILIGDAGMPIPEGVKRIDLALMEGEVPFLKAVEAVLSELQVEAAFIAEEMEEISPKMKSDLIQEFDDHVEWKVLTHEGLKKKSAGCKAAIRTGEFTPYSNVILQAGVVF